MSNYEIEKDVPMIKKRKYPFDEMEVGESFLEPDFRKYHSINTQARTAQRRSGNKKRFTVFNTEDGVRTWRVK